MVLPQEIQKTVQQAPFRLGWEAKTWRVPPLHAAGRCVKVAAMRLPLCLTALCTLAFSALAQEAGWHYSPYPGEGDRAAMGCTRGSTPQKHACMVVRCEDDFSVYVKTSRPEGDVGKWVVQIDDAAPLLETVPVAEGLPYGGKIVETDTEIPTLVEALKQSAFVFIEPLDGEPPVPDGIIGTGSLHAINQALYFCAPRNPPASSADDSPEQGADAGGSG
jgi:hypothetical protein